MVEDKIDDNEVDQWGEFPGVVQQKSMEYSIKSKRSSRARYSYGIIFFITNLIAWFVRDYGDRALPLLRCEFARVGAGEPATQKCSPQQQNSGHGGWTTVIGFLIGICAIVMATFSTGIDSQTFQFRKDKVQSDDDVPYKYGFFHLVFP
ncbi:hypothetical protein RND71_022515 [Anisodus tanguticus]|uniref:Uncharacterized protein n=1 Tax=Anisodus tanguticus TaxID=243964 RepID=A0AAE1VDU5_9SOLA|nr:hypothetical protein RND71_022515 [Anisodus tanguticus]